MRGRLRSHVLPPADHHGCREPRLTLRTAAHEALAAAYRLPTRALDDVTGGARTENWDRLGILYTLLLVSRRTLRAEPCKLLDTAMARLPPETVSTFRLCYDA
ncbi:hypothetical protein [Streptomyces sp. NPDC002172]